MNRPADYFDVAVADAVVVAAVDAVAFVAAVVAY